MITHEGRLIVPDRKIGIVVARFNELITDRLLEGALWTFARHGGDSSHVEVARVPGAYELPIAAMKMAQTEKFAAVICLGCVIRGATSHYDYVCGPAASGIANVAIQTGVPTVFGVLTVDTLEQAFDRAGAKVGNKGSEAMEAALEMADLLHQIEGAGEKAGI